MKPAMMPGSGPRESTLKWEHVRFRVIPFHMLTPPKSLLKFFWGFFGGGRRKQRTALHPEV